MSQAIALAVLACAFAVATVRTVHMGALTLAAALAVGPTIAGMSVDDILAGFPADLFLLLLGVTLLFGIAKTNGAMEWVVDRALRAVGGRSSLLPAIFFLLTGAVSSLGSPLAACAVIPVAMSFAGRNRISPVFMGVATATGLSAGGFAPTSLFGLVTAGVARRSGIDFDPLFLFGAAIALNVLLFAGAWLLFRNLLVEEAAEEPGSGTASASGTTAGPAPAPSGPGGVATAVAPAPAPARTRLNGFQRLTVGALAVFVVAVLGMSFAGIEVNVGGMALGLAVVISLIYSEQTAAAVKEVDWSTILLVGGIVTYVGVLDHMGAVETIADLGTKIPSPLLAAFVLCVCGGLISAFGSTTALLPIIIPLSVPLMAAGDVPALGVICALALSSSLVDVSPLSTVGATIMGATPERVRPQMRSFLFRWGFSMVIIGPVATCAVLVVPGMLA